MIVAVGHAVDFSLSHLCAVMSRSRLTVAAVAVIVERGSCGIFSKVSGNSIITGGIGCNRRRISRGRCACNTAAKRPTAELVACAWSCLNLCGSFLADLSTGSRADRAARRRIGCDRNSVLGFGFSAAAAGLAIYSPFI